METNLRIFLSYPWLCAMIFRLDFMPLCRITLHYITLHYITLHYSAVVLAWFMVRCCVESPFR